MLRKLSLVAIAAASLGVAALAPTSASAWGGRHHGGWHQGWGFGGPRVVGGPAYYAGGYGGCYVDCAGAFFRRTWNLWLARPSRIARDICGIGKGKQIMSS